MLPGTLSLSLITESEKTPTPSQNSIFEKNRQQQQPATVDCLCQVFFLEFRAVQQQDQHENRACTQQRRRAAKKKKHALLQLLIKFPGGGFWILIVLILVLARGFTHHHTCKL
jgi:hypothetical protein